MFNLFILLLFIQLSLSVHLPCVTFNENCYYKPCCKPYICYEDTTCISNNNITNITKKKHN